MTVQELMDMLKGVDPEMQVVFTSDGHDFCCPCPEETGVMELGEACDKEGNPKDPNPGDPTHFFALIPCSVNWEEVAA